MYQNILRRYMNGEFTVSMSDTEAAKHIYDYTLYLSKLVKSGSYLDPKKWTSFKLFINRYPGSHTWLSLYLKTEFNFKANMTCKADLMTFIETSIALAFLAGQEG